MLEQAKEQKGLATLVYGSRYGIQRVACEYGFSLNRSLFAPTREVEVLKIISKTKDIKLCYHFIAL